MKFRGFVWMKWFGLKIGLKLKIIEFSSIWRVYFFGVFDHVSWNFGCQTLFCFGSFLLLQRMIHFSVLEMKKHGQNPRLGRMWLLWFSTERTSCRWKRAKHNRSGPFVAVASLRHVTKMSHVFHKDISFLNLFPEVVLRKSIFLSREFSRYS